MYHQASGVPAGFLSTLPARGATPAAHGSRHQRGISIHAPREGSDVEIIPRWCFIAYFYPRSPRGERRRGDQYPATKSDHFYPRSPRGERRILPGIFHTIGFAFLSTLPARGATYSRPWSRRFYSFLSTLPARGATWQVIFVVRQCNISIHAPREGSDSFS